MTKELLPVLITLLAAAGGWWTVHRLKTREDLLRQRREQRTEMMIGVFEELTKLRSYSQTLSLHDIAGSLSKISTGIELFGTESQLQLFGEMTRTLSSGKLLGVHDLIDSIRDDIRDSLELPQVKQTVSTFRFNVSPGKSEA